MDFQRLLSRSFATVLALGMAAPDSVAQRAQLVGGALDLGSVIGQACVLVPRGDQLIGVGPDYRASFERDGPVFVPASRTRGIDAALRFSLHSYGRRGGPARQVGAARRVQERSTVRYVRDGIVETYELRPEGVKQSFVFHERPVGSGDLVVRGRIETALPLGHAAPDGVTFEVAGVAGVRVGAVTGIDADGNTIAGSLRWDDGVLEMSLPQGFVDHAALPIVLDPLLQSAFGFSSPGTTAYGVVDVAYNPESDLYLVAWDATSPFFSSYYSSGFVLAQLVRGDGTLQASAFGLASGWGVATAAYPRVASVRGSRGFVFGLSFGLYVINAIRWGRVDESGPVPTGGLPTWVPPTSLFPGANAALIDIGGEATTADDDALLVHANQGIHVAELDTLSGRTTATTVIGTTGSQPAISTSGGSTGRYLVTWTDSSDIWGAVIDRDLNVLQAPFSIAATGFAEGNPEVDGDGTNWVVAYERTIAPGNREIYCRGVTFDARSSTAYLTAAEVSVAASARDEAGPAVAWLGDSYLIGYRRQFAAWDWDVFVRSLESFDCRSCEGRIAVARSGRFEGNLRIASHRSGGGTGDEALITWRDSPVVGGVPTGGTVMAWRYRADDGLVTNLSGGCGQGGNADATCAMLGAGAFGLRVQHAASSSPAWPLLGLSSVNFPCGPCTLITSPVAVLGTTTDGRGNAKVTTALSTDPSQLGVKLLTQWVIATTPGSCAAAFSLSNGIQVEIQ